MISLTFQQISGKTTHDTKIHDNDENLMKE